jgi:glutamyl-tRNA(Gln) amidotransferase subunit D
MTEREPSEDPWPLLLRQKMGTPVEIETADGRSWRGVLLPSHELSGERIARLKLDSGYNIGLHIDPKDHVRLLDSKAAPEPEAAPARTAGEKPSADGPWITLLSTGGTIASRVDYRTGGVRPVQTEQEVLSFFPDLGRDGPVRFVPVSDRLSEELRPDDWSRLAEETVRAFAAGARGVVIAHGTDTLAYTAAALSFLVTDLPGPVVLVGAQRSPDRPSSDSFSNLAHAARLARLADLGEVVVVMHEGLSDDRFAIHRGTRVRKTHSTRRDAFRTRDGPPLGVIEGERVQWNGPYRPRGTGPARLTGPLDPSAGILWFHPGLDPARAERYATGLRGLVIAGTGLGHVSLVHAPWIRAAVERGTVIVMTTQCLSGSADPFVYSTGRELYRAGVLYGRDLLPETALAKLMCSLGRSKDPKEVRRLMLEERAREFEDRHAPVELA